MGKTNSENERPLWWSRPSERRRGTGLNDNIDSVSGVTETRPGPSRVGTGFDDDG